jgi:4-amino-4-deoxy-L-arabinose transferase-like glycosyltransferase
LDFFRFAVIFYEALKEDSKTGWQKMNALLTVAALALVVGVMLVAPKQGAAALLLCGALACVAGYFVSRAKEDKRFLLQVFVVALLVRVFIGAAIYYFQLQDFFGGDAYTYDTLGSIVLQAWRSGSSVLMGRVTESEVGYGMAYFVAVIYWAVGQNMLAVQFANAVLGGATAPVIYLCARHIFHNLRVARISALFVAFYPSLVLWSAQGLKDGPMVFLLTLAMLATLELDEKFRVKHVIVLIAALAGIMSLRFYVFYMMIAAIGGSLVIGMRTVRAQSLMRQATIIVGVGLAMTYLGVLRNAGMKLERYGNLEAVQVARADLASSAKSGFAKDVDVSTAQGALSTIPVGMVYLLFAPFPWQLASLRQSITLPEMVVWWTSFPLLCAGLWFTLRHRMRQALPILIFTMMLTLAYSVFQGNVGTAYRQRSQLLVFYFIFVSVGYELLRERREEKKRQVELDKLRMRAAALRGASRRRKDHEWETIAETISEKIGF